ncbi:unnamed protein product [Rangifer tarandus platyrhynchus]|uniref:Uncharacterized protein n=2 Tax=Rangifer tarandus platyrhynchus TaxID=3082113 RepID=A0ABN8Z5G3_RANTA|nr:unnamed protein product [Rangifer tarandus platyrhynchus]
MSWRLDGSVGLAWGKGQEVRSRAGEGTNPEVSRGLRPHALPGRQPPSILCTCIWWEIGGGSQEGTCAGRGFPALGKLRLRPGPLDKEGPLTCLPLTPITGSPRGSPGDRTAWEPQDRTTWLTGLHIDAPN